MKRITLPLLFFFALIIFMFYPVFLKGLIPFPGDLLVSEYQPWKSYSHNGIAPGGVPNKAQYFDALRQMYPWQTITSSSIRNNQFPLWNAHNFSGTPLFANIQSSILYPLKFLYLVLPQQIAWTLLVILQPLLSLLFMFWYMRIVGSSKIGAFIASFTFAFCLFTSTFLEYNSINHILYLLPLSLVCIEQLKNRFSVSYGVLFISSIVFGFFAGHIQVWSGCMAFLFLYCSIRILSDSQNPKRFQTCIRLFLLSICALGITAIQLLPSIELILQSARANQPYTFLLEHLLIQPYQLILYLVPDVFGNPANRNYLLSDSYATKALYIGLAPFLLSIFSLLTIKTRVLVKTFWIIFIVVATIIIRNPISELLYKIPIPFISTSSPSNFICILSVCLSVLAGFGIDAVQKQNRNFLIKILVSIVVVFILTFLTSKIFHIPISIKNYLYSFGIFVLSGFILMTKLHFPKMQTLCLIFLYIIIFFDLFYFFHKFNPFVPYTYIYPENSMTTWLQTKPGIDRVWGYGSAGFQENIASLIPYYSPEGYDPLYPKQYGKFLLSTKDGHLPKTFTNQTRSDAVVYPGWGETDMSSNQFRQKILNILGVKYIVTRIEDPISEKTFPVSLFDLIDSFDGFKIFQSKFASPRVFISNSFKIFTTDQEFEQTFFDPSFNPQSTILLEEKPNETFIDLPLRSSVNIDIYKNNLIKVSANTNQMSLLFLSDTYYPGWHAYIDGVETKIYRAHYTFRAVVVPKGNHSVEFRYTPLSFILGLIISLCCIMLTISYLFYLKKHEK